MGEHNSYFSVVYGTYSEVFSVAGRPACTCGGTTLYHAQQQLEQEVQTGLKTTDYTRGRTQEAEIQTNRLMPSS